MYILFILLHTAFSQSHGNKNILSTIFPIKESTAPNYNNSIQIFPEINSKIKTENVVRGKHEIEPKDLYESKSIWRENNTNTEIFENDPIEQEIAEMVPRAKTFFENSGLELYTSKPISIRPMSSEAEITMSMSTLPEKIAPDMQPKDLKLEMLSASSLTPNDFMRVDTTTHIPIKFKFGKDSDILSRMDRDIQQLVEEVATLKKMVFRLIYLYEKERRRVPKKKRHNFVQLANKLKDFSSPYIHTFKDTHYNF